MIRWLSRCQVVVSDQARLFDTFYIYAGMKTYQYQMIQSVHLIPYLRIT